MRVPTKMDRGDRRKNSPLSLSQTLPIPSYIFHWLHFLPSTLQVSIIPHTLSVTMLLRLTWYDSGWWRYQPNTCWQCQLWHDYLCWWLCKCSQRHGSPPFKLCNLCKTLRFVVLLVVNLSLKVSQKRDSYLLWFWQKLSILGPVVPLAMFVLEFRKSRDEEL